MIFIFIILCILLIVGCAIAADNVDYCDINGWHCGIVIGVLFLIGNLFCLIMLIDQVKELNIIDSKIQMYQEENNQIENDIDVLVKQYMEHEKNTLKEFKTSSSLTLINLYPELKSNELVQQQINLYVENNNKIKQLRENKLDYQVSKWWLYFGKVGDSNE